MAFKDARTVCFLGIEQAANIFGLGSEKYLWGCARVAALGLLEDPLINSLGGVL